MSGVGHGRPMPAAGRSDAGAAAPGGARRRRARLTLPPAPGRPSHRLDTLSIASWEGRRCPTRSAPGRARRPRPRSPRPTMALTEQPSAQDVRAALPAEVTAVRVTYADLHGVQRGKDVPVAELEHVPRVGLAFCWAVMGTDLRHTPVVGGERGYPDMVAPPDLVDPRASCPGSPTSPSAWPTSSARHARARADRPAPPGAPRRGGARRARARPEGRPRARVLPPASPTSSPRRRRPSATSTTSRWSTRSARRRTPRGSSSRCSRAARRSASARSPPTTSS